MSTFPAAMVVSSYLRLERQLRGVLEVVPYCDAHRGVWSPALVAVLLDAGSQIDSLWRTESRLSRSTASDPNLVDFFTYFGQYLHYRWVVFWGDEPIKLFPYQKWAGKTSFKKPDYSPLSWWQAYTKLKHDRLENRTLATMENSVRAVAALFLAILRCEQCRDEIVQAKWLTSLYHRPELWLNEQESTVTWDRWITAETSLFTYPVGWCRKAITKGSNWDNEGASHRWKRWHEQNEQVAS